MLGCRDAYNRKSAAEPLLTNTTQYHYKLTSQLYTGPILAVNVNINTVRMSISATTPGGWEGACTEAATDKNCIR